MKTMVSTLGSVPIFVCGLCFHIRLAETAPAKPILAGPALYAALGLRRRGYAPQLISAFGQNLTSEDRALLQEIDPDALTRFPLKSKAMLQWTSPAVLDDTGAGMLSDDPRDWMQTPPNSLPKGSVLILANGDPHVYASYLAKENPACVLFDLHASWFSHRSVEIATCIQKANILTMTEHEYTLLSKSALSGTALGRAGKILILKRGPQGVVIKAFGQEWSLPPPAARYVHTDIGCGDFLLGLIAGGVIQEAPPFSPEILQKAYLQALDPLAQLLESSHPRKFLEGQVRVLGESLDA